MKKLSLICSCGTAAAVVASIAATIAFLTAVPYSPITEENGAFGWWWARWTTAITLGCCAGLLVAGVVMVIVRLLEGKKDPFERSYQGGVQATIDVIAGIGAIPAILTMFWWVMFI